METPRKGSTAVGGKDAGGKRGGSMGIGVSIASVVVMKHVSKPRRWFDCVVSLVRLRPSRRGRRRACLRQATVTTWAVSAKSLAQH